MKVEILFDGDVIGTGELEHLDPPMGVAFGPFHPSAAYAPSAHAGSINGHENDVGLGATFVVRGPNGVIECSAVGIEDAQDELGEIQLHVICIADFESYFGDHPDYKAYYGLA